MSEEIEVGGVVVKVRAVAVGVDEILSKLQTAFNQVGKVGQQALQGADTAAAKLRGTADVANVTATAAANMGNDTSGIDKYTAKLDNLNSKFELQRQKSAQLGAELDILAQQNAKLLSQGSGAKDFNFEDIPSGLAAQYDAELAKLYELRDAIKLTEQERANAAAKAQAVQDAAIQKQAQLNQKMANKTDTANTKVGMDAAAMAIRGVSSAAGGAIGNIGYMASEIIFLKRTMDTTVGAGAALGAGISGGIMIAVTLITTAVTAMQQAQEKERQAAADAAKNYQLVNKEVVAMDKNIAILGSQTASIEEVTAAKNALAETFPQMVIGHNEEGNAILTTVEALKEEVKYRKILAEATNKESAANAQISANEYIKKNASISAGNRLVKNGLEGKDLYDYAAAYGAFGGLSAAFTKDEDAVERDIKKWEREKVELFQQAKTNFTAKLAEMGGDDVAKAFVGNIDTALKQGLEAGMSPEEIAQGMIDRYNSVVDLVPEGVRVKAEKAAPEIQAAIQAIYGAAASGTGPINNVTGQVSALLQDGLMDQVKEFEALASKITGGEASNADIARYTSLLETMKNAVGGNADVFGQLSDATLTSADALKASAAKAKAAKSSYMDVAKGVSDFYNGYRDLNNELKDLGAMKAAAQALESGKSAKNYGDALAYVADKYGVTKKEAAGMAGTLQDEISIKENLTVATIMAAQAQAEMQILTVQAMQTAGTVTATQAEVMIAALNKVSIKYKELLNADGTGLNTKKIPISIPKVSTPSSSGSSTNEALQKQLSLLESKKKMDQLTYSEEIAWLKRIRSQYTKNADERRDLDERIYAAKKAQMQAELDHKKAMDQLSLAEEIKALESQLRMYKKNTAERLKLEEEIYDLKKQKAQQDYDLQVYYGKLNLAQQEAALKKQIQQYKKNTEQRIDLEKQLYDIQKQIREQSAGQIDQVAEGLVTALEARYEEQRTIEENRIKDSIDAWKDWGDEQTKAIQTQIDALDELTKNEDRADEERKKRSKIAALEQQLQYETDTYNQKKLQDELAKAQQELQSWLTKNERDDLKANLQEQQNAVKERVDQEQQKLEDQLDANNAYYDELTKSYNLQAEAQKMLMKNNQTEIINLIKAFAPEYNATGQTLGEQLVDGFTAKVGNISAWVAMINGSINSYQSKMASVANSAADSFWRSRGGALTAPAPPASATSAPVTSSPSQVVININQPVQSPIEMRREVERIVKSMSKF